MKLHPRKQIVDAAARDIAQAVIAATEKHDLTYGELTKILSGELADLAKYQIRGERHPGDPDKRGDEE